MEVGHLHHYSMYLVYEVAPHLENISISRQKLDVGCKVTVQVVTQATPEHQRISAVKMGRN